MKPLFSTLALCLFMIIGNFQNSFAQQMDKQNYVVLTKNVQQLKPILLAAEALANQDGEDFGNFEIIVCGKTIGDSTNLEVMQPHLEKAQLIGANIVACGFSLNRFKVDRKRIPKDMKIVKNGILYNFQLQKQGYLSLEL
ncbi:hypothetical protein [Aequorivita capsosiphonis]|uniref:hypothetical protein n=1 Tax=Aequorivita capsosiphonis TaxID=487317 RepID=UPI00040F7D4A|nr:hypothetical protein [Aequorivita capsosiphonis]